MGFGRKKAMSIKELEAFTKMTGRSIIAKGGKLRGFRKRKKDMI